MKKIDSLEIDLDDVYDEYKEDDTIFSEEEPLTKEIKRIIFHSLDEVDRRIILLYAELQSLRKLGKVLGVSASSAFFKVADIKNKIKNNLTEENDMD